MSTSISVRRAPLSPMSATASSGCPAPSRQAAIASQSWLGTPVRRTVAAVVPSRPTAYRAAALPESFMVQITPA